MLRIKCGEIPRNFCFPTVPYPMRFILMRLTKSASAVSAKIIGSGWLKVSNKSLKLKANTSISRGSLV